MLKRFDTETKTPYSYILVSKPLRNTLLVLVICCATALTAFIFLELRGERNVARMVMYTAIICSILVFYPLTETWVYKPWQVAPQKLERHEGK